MSPDAAVQELLDRARIADATYAYCDYVDHGDVEAVVALFTDDGEIDLGGGAVHRGRAELHDMFADRLSLYTTTSYHCSGIRMASYDGVSAATSVYLFAFHEAGELGRQMHLWGRFQDELVLQAGAWKFRRRHLLVAGLNHATSHGVPRRFDRITHLPSLMCPPDREAAEPLELARLHRGVGR